MVEGENSGLRGKIGFKERSGLRGKKGSRRKKWVKGEELFKGKNVV